MIKLLLINILVMAMFALTHGNSEDPETKYLVVNPDKVDYKFTGKKDEHRFGVEVKENKQFHHTRTEEDGVRLGCYGYVHPNGKAYSTHYVADNKGYRIVPHHGDILVYPKDGNAARKASFFESFNEDEIKSSNIRYFFPDGCKSTMIDIQLVDPSATPKPYTSSIFSAKKYDDLKTAPGVATKLNQDNKNFPTKIVPIVTGTFIQTKLNQNKDDKKNNGGSKTVERFPTSENGSGTKVGKSTDNPSLTSDKNTQGSDKIKSGSDNNHINDNSNNDGNHDNNNYVNDNSNADGSFINDQGNNANQHTVPIYSRPSEDKSGSKTGNSLENKYLPANEIEIEEPEKNEFLKIVSVTPSTPITAVVPKKPIDPVIPSKPIDPVIPSKPIVPVVPSIIVPTIPSNPKVPVVPSIVVPAIPSKPIDPVSPPPALNPNTPISPLKQVPSNPIVPAKPIVPAVPSIVVPAIPSKPIDPVSPGPALNPNTPVSPLKPVPSNPIVPAVTSTAIVSVTPSKPIVPVILSSVVPAIPSKPIDPVTPASAINPITPVTPFKTIPLNSIVSANVNQCQDCCEDTQRPILLMVSNSETTCCKKDVAKLSIPISMDKLAKISMIELIEITSETNTITMLKKLLALAEKYQF